MGQIFDICFGTNIRVNIKYVRDILLRKFGMTVLATIQEISWRAKYVVIVGPRHVVRGEVNKTCYGKSQS